MYQEHLFPYRAIISVMVNLTVLMDQMNCVILDVCHQVLQEDSLWRYCLCYSWSINYSLWLFGSSYKVLLFYILQNVNKMYRNVKKISECVSLCSGFVMENWIALKAQMRRIVLVMSSPWLNVSQSGILQFVCPRVGLGMDILIVSILTQTTTQVK